MIQCGTPPEIFSNPANQYVADFVANMNPLGVLCARDAMISPIRPAPERSITPDMPIRDVLRAFDATHDSLSVREGAQQIGCVTRASVIRALSAERAQPDA